MEQRIAACLHADVSGYCRLIAADVEGTVRTLKAYRTAMARVVAEHAGRVVDTAGDSFLAEFASVPRAVRCAIDMQHELEALNAALPRSRRLEFRIGIDLGRVVVDDERIYGDCVNIAARVQEAALPGSVCLAGAAYDHLDEAVPVRFEYLGERRVKSFDAPQRVYRLERGGAGRPSSSYPARASFSASSCRASA
jgi:adenylate cyclase